MKRGKKKNSWSYAYIGLIVFFFLILLIPLIILVLPDGNRFGNVAVIQLNGVITMDDGGVFGQDGVSAREVRKFIEEAEDSSTIKAILIDINSPGGTAVASDEIASAIKKANKPTVAFIHEVGASGAYWAASATDHIIANRMSITGSIGVISSYLEFSGLMKEFGVGYERLVAGERKDVGTPFRQLSFDERNLLQKKIDVIHDVFINSVAVNRGMPVTELRPIANGEFFLGLEALQLGLVDELGDQDNVIEYLESVGVKNPDFVFYSSKPSLLDVLGRLMQPAFFSVGQGIGDMLKPRRSMILT